MDNKVWIVTIDPGKKNLGFIIQEVDMAQFNKIRFVPKDDRYDDDGEHTSPFKKNIKEICRASKVILWKKVDITGDSKKYFDHRILYELTKILDSYLEYWNRCHYIIIEEQMSFGNKHNTMAIKVAQHIQSYFIFNYFRFKEIVMFPSYHKTKVLGALKGITKPQRKKWSTEFVNELIKEIEYNEEIKYYEKTKKKDDLSDCMLMVYAFLIKNFKK